MAKKKSKEPLENFTGGFLRIPHAVFDSNAFAGATDRAKALLIALARQINGKNNGKLHLTDKWLSAAGYRSKSANDRARDELIERGLIVQTKRGGLNIGCDWFAVTWLPIGNFSDLDLSPSSYRQGIWSNCGLPPTMRRQPPKKEKDQPGHGVSKNKISDPTTGSALTRPPGQAPLATDPTTGSEKAIFCHFTDPTTGHNVSIPSPIRLVRGVK